MRIDFVTLFPAAVLSAVRHSILSRAETAGIVEFHATNPRDFASDSHKSVDDEPYGGGPGMLMKADIVGKAIESVLRDSSVVVFTDPAGELFSQSKAQELSRAGHIVFVCGHYEGVDERCAQKYATMRVSLGDYVLTGGELPSAVMADAVVRLLPGALGDANSLSEDAFSDGLLTYPQFTRPASWEGMDVPDVLLSGDHQAVARWRRQQRLIATRKHRPGLFARAPLTSDDLKLLQ
jgi:tRNA (guanine37-N1)-methyltransferase